MQNRKILITGGLGYLGSHTALKLLQSDFSLVLLDNFSNSQKKTLELLQKKGGEKVVFYENDMRDFEGLQEIFEKEPEIGMVLHFASKNKQKESCIEPFLYYESNIQGTLNLLKIMEIKKIKNLIYSSTNAIYDHDKNIPPFAENDKVKATTPYGTTKLIIEQILKDMTTHKNFNILCLRHFNPIGAFPEFGLGYMPKGIPTKIIPLLIKVAKGEIESFPIYGEKYPTKDGSCLMDYIHIADVTEAHKKMVEYLFEKTKETTNEINLPKAVFEVVNICTGVGKTIKELIELTELVTNQKIPYQTFPERTGDHGIVLGNNNKLRSMFHREPQKTVLEAIEDEWKFEQQKI